jgi:hypothetical protein
MPDESLKIIWGFAEFVAVAVFGSLLSAFGQNIYALVKPKVTFELKSKRKVEHDFKSRIDAMQNYT